MGRKKNLLKIRFQESIVCVALALSEHLDSHRWLSVKHVKDLMKNGGTHYAYDVTDKHVAKAIKDHRNYERLQSNDYGKKCTSHYKSNDANRKSDPLDNDITLPTIASDFLPLVALKMNY